MKTEIRVLIVEDDRSSATLFTEVVKRLGYKPVAVSKVADAMNVARMQTVHAAIIDVLLPKMSGVDLAAEFRKTKFASNPVILVSGIFKDKAFIAEALKKAEAASFLTKPIDTEVLLNTLKEALSSLQTEDKPTVKSLLTRQLNTNRQRAKAIENLEELKGMDLPFVLGIIMNGKLSGDLNIFNENGEIFGVKLVNGLISVVDSAESLSNSVLQLIANGYLTKEDWDQLQANGKRRFALEYLVQEGLVSPHAVADSRHQQILYDLRSMVSAKSLQLNFVVTEDGSEVPKHAVSLKQLLEMLSQSMDDFFPVSYLMDFYSPVREAALLRVAEASDLEGFWQSKAFSGLSELRAAVENGGSLAQALAAQPDKEGAIYLALHFLVLSRAVLFTDAAKEKIKGQELERFRRLHSELKGKSPDQVFRYFNGREVTNSLAAEKVFNEYTRSNHPDNLPKDAPKDLVVLCRECFDIVNAAFTVMFDDQKRTALLESKKEEMSRQTMLSKELTVQGLELLRKGQFEAAAEALTKAGEANPNTTQFLIKIWADIKNGTLSTKPDLTDVLKKMDELSADDRKSSYYFMAVGLIKKALGDATAVTFFEKALQADSTFVDARRELNALNNAARESKDKKVDLLTGDIGTLVSQLFRRKAE